MWSIIFSNINILILEEGNPDNKDKTKSNKKKKVDVNNVKRSKYKDTESGVARGIDFVLVSNVVNFNFPKVSSSIIFALLLCFKGVGISAGFSQLDCSVDLVHIY